MSYIIVDDFLECYPELKEYSLSANYSDISNPADGVVYPDICDHIPDSIRPQIIVNLTRLVGRMIKCNYLFLRMSKKGVHVPHIAHTDNSMGNYSMMLYLNDNDDAGTSFIRHKESGICYAPESDQYKNIIVSDQNNNSKWETVSKVSMKQNRAVIFDSHVLHRAEPVGGFGDSVNNSRIVMTCFFS